LLFFSRVFKNFEVVNIYHKSLFSCRFGTVKSIHVARHCKDNNLATKSEEVKKKVGSEEPTPDAHTVTNDAESSFSEEATYSNSKGTGGMEFHGDKKLEEKDNDGTSVNVDKNAEVFDNTTCHEHLVSDSTVIDAGNEGLPSSTIQGCPDQGNTPNDDPELHDSMVANDIDVEKTVGGNTDSENTVCPFQEGFAECDASLELVGPSKDIKEEDDEEDDTYNHVFEEGAVLVEYARSEACRSAAHCLHRRLFDGRMVTVQYVAPSLYRARFTK